MQRSVRAVREKETSQSLDRQQPTTVQQNLPDQQVNATGAKNQNDEKQRREGITNYEVSSKTVTTTSDGFVVNKMSFAVLVNRPRLIASLGDKVSDAAIEAKVAEISQIAATAAGIDRPRGDQIQVSAVEFMEGARDLAPVPSITFAEVMMRQAGSLVSAITIPSRGRHADLVLVCARQINTILAMRRRTRQRSSRAETNALLRQAAR